MKNRKDSSEPAVSAGATDPKNQLQTDQSPKLHCLFCYKLVVHLVNDGDNLKEIYFEDKGKRKAQICNRFYSHVIVRKDGIRKGFSGEEEKLENKNCGVCDDCLYVIESHCRVYEEIEVLKLKLRWQLDKFHKVMKYAGKVPSRVKAFKDSFQIKETGKKDDMEAIRQRNLDEVMAFRRKIFGGCAAGLKFQSLKVSVSPLKNRPSADVRDEEEGNVPGNRAEPEPEPASSQQEAESDSEPDSENEAGPSNLEVLYIVKTEDANGEGGQRHQRIVTPPESILETLRSGYVPMEGVSRNHYFYCEEPIVQEQSLVPAEGSSRRHTNSNRDPDLINQGLDQDTGNETGNPVYHCIRCSQQFRTAKRLISHAKESHCFDGENIREKSGENKPRSPNLKRKRASSEECIVNQGSAKKVRNSDIIPASLEKNVVSNAVNKVLTGLRSTFKCPNCSVTFREENEFKDHIFARDCFKKLIKLKRLKNQDNIKSSSSNNEGDSTDLDSSSSSAFSSSSQSGEDSDYAPKPSRPLNPKRKKGKVDGRIKKRKPSEREVIKTRCSIENCAKFFLYKVDYERHLLQHGFFSCEFCHYTTDLAGNIVNHEIQQHSKKSKDDKILCPRCRNKNLSSEKSQQTDHYMRVHLFPVNKSAANKNSRHK